MNIQQLQYICAVARYGSMCAASQKLFVTQQTISKAIINLEKELGYNLLDREYNGVRVTDYGNEFVQKANTILSDIHDLYQIGSNIPKSADYSESITLPCCNYFIHRIAPYLSPLISQEFPRVQLRFEEGYIKDVVSTVSNDRCLGFITLLNDKTACYQADRLLSRLNTIHLYDDEVFILCNESNKLSQLESVCISELSEYPIILAPLPGIEKILFDDYGIKLNVFMYSDDFCSLCETISLGLAIGFSTAITMSATDVPDNVKAIPVIQRPVAKGYFVYPTTYELSLVEREIIKHSSRIIHNF